MSDLYTNPTADEARVVLRLEVMLGVEGVTLVDDEREQLHECADPHVIGQVFAHMLRDTQVFNNAIDLLPQGEATPRSMVVLGVQSVYPCRTCGWANACGEPAGEDCHS